MKHSDLNGKSIKLTKYYFNGSMKCMKKLISAFNLRPSYAKCANNGCKSSYDLNTLCKNSKFNENKYTIATILKLVGVLFFVFYVGKHVNLGND